MTPSGSHTTGARCVCSEAENSAIAAIVKCFYRALIVQELCESRGGRPGLSVLTSLLVSVDVKLY